jgi:hypothetical protein
VRHHNTESTILYNQFVGMASEFLSVLAPSKFYVKPSFLLKKLFTKEDPKFLHKTFGLFSVVSFLYRYFIVFANEGNLGFNGSAFDWVTIALHMGLSSSSLIFHVLARRIVEKPMIIWQEYRLHAIVFTLRCCSVFAFGCVRGVFSGSWIENVSLFTFVMSHHLVVDEITRRFGPVDKTQTTVRVDGKSTVATKVMLRFYAFYQFSALASHLLPHPRLMDLGFNALVAIQSSAFLMTLFRKGLIRYYSHGLWYTACLVLSLYHIVLQHPNSWFWSKVLMAFLVRVNLRANKYLIWTVFMLVSIPAIESRIFEHAYILMEQGVHQVPSNPFSHWELGMEAVSMQSLSARALSMGRDISNMDLNTFKAMSSETVATIGHSLDTTSSQTMMVMMALMMTAGYMGRVQNMWGAVSSSNSPKIPAAKDQTVVSSAHE